MRKIDGDEKNMEKKKITEIVATYFVASQPTEH